MEALVVDSGRIADEIVRIPGDIHIVTGPEAVRTTPPSSGVSGTPRPRPGRPRPGGGGVVPRRQTVPADRALVGDPALQMRRMTMEAFQAERALAVWMGALHAFLGHSERLARYSLTEATASDLVSELIEASRRLGLDARIRAALERWNFSLRSERRAGPAATVAAESINAFVARLGMDEIPEAERPVVDTGDGASRPVFEETPVRYAFRTLPDRPELTAEDRLLDWTFALHRTFEDNARHVDGVEVDMEQNLRLGEILAGLRCGQNDVRGRIAVNFRIEPDPRYPLGGHALLVLPEGASSGTGGSDCAGSTTTGTWGRMDGRPPKCPWAPSPFRSEIQATPSRSDRTRLIIWRNSPIWKLPSKKVPVAKWSGPRTSCRRRTGPATEGCGVPKWRARFFRQGASRYVLLRARNPRPRSRLIPIRFRRS